jgi:hypothetical protein
LEGARGCRNYRYTKINGGKILLMIGF